MMEKKFDITAMGELLIDFAPAGKSDTGMKLFEQNPGGAPANMLAAAKMVGLNVAFMGKVGADMHGIYLESVLEGQVLIQEHWSLMRGILPQWPL